VNLLDLETIQVILQRPSLLTKHIAWRLHERYGPGSLFSIDGIDLTTTSAVLFLLGQFPGQGRLAGRPCLILNKRSANVRQPGDLCCPGGRVNLRLDGILATLLRLPILPLARWPYWSEWHRRHPGKAKWLRLLLATGLRESVEEIRLNPFGLKLLGPLPPQPLLMFQRIIYPMVMWITGQKRFYPNWEVEKIIYIPLQDLLNPARYARYRLRIETRSNAIQVNTFPCFRYEKENETELLWGATYRITMVFLKNVFGFVPPAADSLSQIDGRLSRSYLNST
jgi:hypothetical protein